MDSQGLLILHIAELATCIPTSGDSLGRIRDGAIAIVGEHIAAVGTTAQVLGEFGENGWPVYDASGLVAAPGFVDSHTHVVFGGSRVREYAARLTRTPAEVKALGIPTGIVSTMAMTRAASEDDLFESAASRIGRMLQAGTTTLESKSGYGLDLANELKMLRVNRRLHSELPVDIVSTFLGAHAFPPGIPPEGYVEQIITEMIPEVAAQGLAEFCDVYIDEGYFNLAQTRRILEAGRAAGFRLKLHADQYSALGGSRLAAELGVVSVDHLNYTRPEDAQALAQAGVVGVLMPLIDFAVRHPHPFDAAMLRASGLTLALATDICPGGWVESMQLVVQFACRVHGFTPEEALLASTVGGAAALGLADRGALAPGLLADIQLWKADCIEDVAYRIGANLVHAVFKRGQQVV